MRSPLVFQLLCLALLGQLSPAADLAVASAEYTADLHSFVTRPEIKAPKFNVTYYDRERTAPGYWFVAPYSFIEPKDVSVGWTPCEFGPHIYDSEGILVWTGACTYAGQNVFDFKAVTNIDEQPRLSLLTQDISNHQGIVQGGTALVLNGHYEQEHAVNVKTEFDKADVHEFNILDGGKTALVALYRTQAIELSYLGFSEEIRHVIIGGFEEIDLATGDVLFSWDSLPYIPLDESTYRDPHTPSDNVNLSPTLMDAPPLTDEPPLIPSDIESPGIPLSDLIPGWLPQQDPPSLMDLPLENAPPSTYVLPSAETPPEIHAPGHSGPIESSNYISVDSLNVPSATGGSFWSTTRVNQGSVASGSATRINSALGSFSSSSTTSSFGSHRLGHGAYTDPVPFTPDEGADPLQYFQAIPVDADDPSSAEHLSSFEPAIIVAEKPPKNQPLWSVTPSISESENSATTPQHRSSRRYLSPTLSTIPYGLQWDYLHVNSIDKNSDGNYLVSARYTNTIYLISGKDGNIIWRLGGRYSDFAMRGFNFARQHHARFVEHNSTHTVISFLDNASDEYYQLKNVSTAYYVLLKTTYPKTAKVLRSYQRPDKNLSRLLGNVQTLPNENVFVGWSDGGYQSEFTQDGQLVMEASFVSDRFSSYRSYKYEFVGHPTEPLVVKSLLRGSRADDLSTSIYVSWNGATEVVRWNFYAKADNTSATTFIGSVPKTGFENMFAVHGYMDWVTVSGVDADGMTLGMSDIVRTEISEEWLSATYNHSGDTGAVNTPVPTPDVPIDPSLKDSTTTNSNDNFIAKKLGVEGSLKTMFLAMVGALAILLLFAGAVVYAVISSCKLVRRRRRRYTQIPTEEAPLPTEEYRDSGLSSSLPSLSRPSS